MTILKLSFLFSFIFIFSYSTVESTDDYIKPDVIKMIKSDIPLYKDLMVYLPVLNRLVEFCENKNHMLSLNLLYGLFLTKVNLEQYVNDHISLDLRIYIKKILARCDQLRKDYFKTKDGTTSLSQLFAVITSNATTWARRMPRLNYDLLKETLANADFPRWDIYKQILTERDLGSPTVKQSDGCLISLLGTKDNLSDEPDWRCLVPKECYTQVLNGTDFGYWITHRLLLLIHARLYRNCAIFSIPEDFGLRRQFCEKIYREVEYIASNDFQEADLMMEMIIFCALDGHAQFIRRSWLLNLLQCQQPNGCFQNHKLKPNEIPDNSKCQDHIVAVAMAAYSAAVRFIIENSKRLIV